MTINTLLAALPSFGREMVEMWFLGGECLCNHSGNSGRRVMAKKVKSDKKLLDHGAMLAEKLHKKIKQKYKKKEAEIVTKAVVAALNKPKKPKAAKPKKDTAKSASRPAGSTAATSTSPVLVTVPSKT